MSILPHDVDEADMAALTGCFQSAPGLAATMPWL